jgi:hypothetical protein
LRYGVAGGLSAKPRSAPRSTMLAMRYRSAS